MLFYIQVVVHEVWAFGQYSLPIVSNGFKGRVIDFFSFFFSKCWFYRHINKERYNSSPLLKFQLNMVCTCWEQIMSLYLLTNVTSFHVLQGPHLMAQQSVMDTNPQNVLRTILRFNCFYVENNPNCITSKGTLFLK